MRGGALHTLGQFLVRPGVFFRERDPASTLPIAASLVVIFAIALGLSMLLVGSMLAGAIDATVTMDNPDRPPDWVCDRYGNDSASHMAQGCDEPETIERDAGSMLYDMTTEYTPYVMIVPFLMWLLGGIVLYVAARLADGSPSIAGAFALAGWASLPEFIRLAIGLAAIRYALADLTITSVSRAEADFLAALSPIEPVLAFATVVTVGWQWYLLTGGLVHDADIEGRAAAVVVGVPLGIWLLIILH